MKLNKHDCTVKEVKIQKVILSNAEARPKGRLQVMTKIVLELLKVQLVGNLPFEVESVMSDMISDAHGDDDEERPEWSGVGFKRAIPALDVKFEGTLATIGLSGVPKGELKAKPSDDDDDRVRLEFKLVSLVDQGELGDLALCLLDGTKITCAPVPDAQKILPFSDRAKAKAVEVEEEAEPPAKPKKKKTRKKKAAAGA